MVTDLDLNLLKVFDALLAEGSVTGAAERLGLSVPATSRALARLRRAVGDPIFVRAGRGLVPTPFALRAASQVRAVLDGAQALLAGERDFDPAALTRTFTIRINDGLAAMLGTDLGRRVGVQAPGVTLRFAAEGDEDPGALRDGTVDLDIGVHPPAPPDLRTELLYTERNVALVAADSPLGRTGRPALDQFCAYPHVVTSRRGRARGPLDDALAQAGYERLVSVVVPSFTTAALLAAQGQLVAVVPEGFARQCVATLSARWFALPVPVPALPITQQWHTRLDLDPAQRWLRAHVRDSTRPHPPTGD
jgi:DNA-binding transcriptional LysR family regulator